MPPNRTTPVVLRIHSGGKANVVTFTTFDWERDYSLVPGQAAEVELPMVNGSVIPLTIYVQDGFSPTRDRSELQRPALPRLLCGRSLRQATAKTP